MRKNYLLLFLATVGLVLSFLWGISKNQLFEPWTAFTSALCYIFGIYYSLDEKKQNKIRQISLFTSNGKSTVKNSKELKGEVSQLQIGGKDNEQKIE